MLTVVGVSYVVLVLVEFGLQVRAARRAAAIARHVQVLEAELRAARS